MEERRRPSMRRRRWSSLALAALAVAAGTVPGVQAIGGGDNVPVPHWDPEEHQGPEDAPHYDVPDWAPTPHADESAENDEGDLVKKEETPTPDSLEQRVVNGSAIANTSWGGRVVGRLSNFVQNIFRSPRNFVAPPDFHFELRKLEGTYYLMETTMLSEVFSDIDGSDDDDCPHADFRFREPVVDITRSNTNRHSQPDTLYQRFPLVCPACLQINDPGSTTQSFLPDGFFWVIQAFVDSGERKHRQDLHPTCFTKPGSSFQDPLTEINECYCYVMVSDPSWATVNFLACDPRRYFEQGIDDAFRDFFAANANHIPFNVNSLIPRANENC